MKKWCKGFVFYLTFFLCVLVQHIHAQQAIFQGIVRDKQSNEPVSFASVVFKKSGKGMLTDSAGNFVFKLTTAAINDTLVVSSVGYKVWRIAIATIKDTAFIEPLLELLPPSNEAIVRVKYNRALWFWRKIMANKSHSDKKVWKNYAYEIHNKLELDINNINKEKLSKNALIKPLNFVFGYIDSTSETKPYLPLYLTETLSDYYYQRDPERIFERIKATKTNGFENESLVKELGGTYQNVNVFNNFIPVFDKEYISPFNTNADNYYYFKLADTAYMNGKRLVHLRFSGKRKGENTFDGDCWVFDTAFAVQKITLRPSAEVNINFIEGLTLIQEFKKINDTAWFIYKDKFVADIAPIGSGKLGFKGRKTTTYTNVIINNESTIAQLQKNKKSLQIDLAPDREAYTDSFWIKNRHEPLDKNEITVYKVIDTLNKNPTYIFYRDAIKILARGTKDFGNIRLGPWFYWVSGNAWEGGRFRFDLATNRGFSNKWNFSGYAAYGTNDQALKGKFQAKYLFDRELWTYLQFTYKNDLDNRQIYYDQLGTDNIFATVLRRPNIPYKFQRIEETKLEFFKETGWGLSFGISANRRRFSPLKNIPTESFYTAKTGNPFQTFETAITLRYAFSEHFIEDNFIRTSLGSKYPIVELKYTKAWQGAFSSTNDYHKLDLTISDYVSLAPYGYFYYNFFGGKVFGTAPYQMLDILPGNELYYFNKYAFNLMHQFEYITDAYAGFNVEHNIGSGLFRFLPITRKLKFRQFWSAKAVVGSLSDANKAYNFVGNYPYKSLDNNVYMEIGTGIDNILRFFRVDFVWGVSPKSIVTDPTRRFGVFASFHLNF
ncbi:MAG: DUF5686 family protein [Sediminibacterium sp.]